MRKLENRHQRDNTHLQHTYMNKAKVSIVRAHDYNYTEIHAAMEKGIELIGGLAKIVPPSSKVFVKINHLSPPSPAEKGIVTHPVFVEAVLASIAFCRFIKGAKSTSLFAGLVVSFSMTLVTTASVPSEPMIS